jgi:hypothetical protein
VKPIKNFSRVARLGLAVNSATFSFKDSTSRKIRTGQTKASGFWVPQKNEHKRFLICSIDAA